MTTINITQPDNRDMINVDIKSPKEKISVNVKDKTKNVYEFKLNLRRALNGDLMIFDHNDIDIIILIEKNKIVAFPKDMMSEVVYGAENRLFTFLRSQGVIAYDSIQGGSVYGSLEGLILENKNSKEPESLDYVLFQIYEWVKTEKPYFDSVETHDEMMDDAILDPSDEFSTELGEVPHEEEKGSIKPRSIFGGSIYGRHMY
jgi:hypothetical protein